MARSLLIALLALAAVAGPGAALGPVASIDASSPTDPAVALDPTPLLDAFAAVLVVMACQTDLCSTDQEAVCRPIDAKVHEEVFPPTYSLEYDPDGCIRRMLERLPPGDWISWTTPALALEADQLSGDQDAATVEDAPSSAPEPSEPSDPATA